MKLVKLMLALMLLVASVAGQNAWADRGHFHHGGHARVGVSIGVGVPLGWPWWYEPYPYYYPYYPYYSRPTIVESGPTEYVERSQSQGSESPASNYWYYCHRPDGYYPYVKECPGGWDRVTPQPVPPHR